MIAQSVPNGRINPLNVASGLAIAGFHLWRAAFAGFETAVVRGFPRSASRKSANLRRNSHESRYRGVVGFGVFELCVSRSIGGSRSCSCVQVLSATRTAHVAPHRPRETADASCSWRRWPSTSRSGSLRTWRAAAGCGRGPRLGWRQWLAGAERERGNPRRGPGTRGPSSRGLRENRSRQNTASRIRNTGLIFTRWRCPMRSPAGPTNPRSISWPPC